MSEAPDPCPYCGTQMKDGAPVDDYCPNKECTGHRDKFMEEFRRWREAFEADQRMRAVAPDLYAALEAALPYVSAYESEHMSNVALDVYSRGTAALSRARGGKPT